MRISEDSRMPSASEIYAQRRAAANARAPGARPHRPEMAVTRATPMQGIDAAAIYARRRDEAQMRGRAAGYVR